MNKSVYFLTLSLWFYGCVSPSETKEASLDTKTIDMTKTERGTIYNGYWLDKTFLETLKKRKSIVNSGTIPEIIEFGFFSAKNDSVMINSGTEISHVPIQFVSEDSASFREGTLAYEKQVEIEYLYWIDKKKERRPYERMGNDFETEEGGVANSLTPFINKNTVSGDYFFTDPKGRKTDDFFVLKPDGKIIGWDKYNHYKVCLNKEVLNRTNYKKDVIYLTLDNNSGDYFAWEFFDYDEDNAKEENKGKKPKQFGMVLRIYKLGEKKNIKEKEKPDFEFAVSKLYQ